MAESFKERISGLARHLRRHTRKLASREEGAGDALSGVAKETGRFMKHLVKPKTTRDRKEAVALVNKAKDAYNAGDFPKAEKYLKKALSEDNTYARAWMYLGNTYYKLGNNVEAGYAWTKAIEAEPNSEAAEKAREKIKKTGHGETEVLYTEKHPIRKSQ